MDIIAKNNTESAISITDLYGVKVPASGQLDLLEQFDPYKISQSTVLQTKVSDEDITINDGTSDLSVANGLKHLKFLTEYELKHKDTTLPSQKDIRLSMCAKKEPHIEINKSVWSVAVSFIFRGTNFVGTPTGFKVLTYVSKNNGDLRLVRSDTGAVIGSVSAISETILTIKTNTSLSNLPTTDTILELQGKINTTGKIYIAEFLLYY